MHLCASPTNHPCLATFYGSARFGGWHHFFKLAFPPLTLTSLATPVPCLVVLFSEYVFKRMNYSPRLLNITSIFTSPLVWLTNIVFFFSPRRRVDCERTLQVTDHGVAV
jgi:hypothetical protein